LLKLPIQKKGKMDKKIINQGGSYFVLVVARRGHMKKRRAGWRGKFLVEKVGCPINTRGGEADETCDGKVRVFSQKSTYLKKMIGGAT